MNRIDAIFDVERGINGLDAAARLEARQRLVRPLVDELHDWTFERGTVALSGRMKDCVRSASDTDVPDQFGSTTVPRIGPTIAGALPKP